MDDEDDCETELSSLRPCATGVCEARKISHTQKTQIAHLHMLCKTEIRYLQYRCAVLTKRKWMAGGAAAKQQQVCRLYITVHDCSLVMHVLKRAQQLLHLQDVTHTSLLCAATRRAH
jgi:hypothetical protein